MAIMAVMAMIRDGATITNRNGEPMKENGVDVTANGLPTAAIGVGGKNIFVCGPSGIVGIKSRQAF